MGCPGDERHAGGVHYHRLLCFTTVYTTVHLYVEDADDDDDDIMLVMKWHTVNLHGIVISNILLYRKSMLVLGEKPGARPSNLSVQKEP